MTGGIVTVEDSNWLMSWTLNRQQQFRDQPKDQLCVWVYGLFPDKPGNYVKKPMQDCTGEEIGEEWLYHMDVDRGVPEVWGSVYDVRNLLNATVMLRDGKPITDMKLNPIERGVLKQIVKKLDSTDIPTLLKEYGVI